MQLTTFLSLITDFAQRPVPSLQTRHVYLWHGPTDRLRDTVPSDVHLRLDLRNLALSLPSAPSNRDQVARLFRQALSEQLTAKLDSQRQQIVTVTGCDLLSRYGLPLQPFFQVASERVMVVLAVEPQSLTTSRASQLPDYVIVSPSATYEYLRNTVGDLATVNVEEVAQ